MRSVLRVLRSCVILSSIALSGIANAAVISVAAPVTTAPGYLPALPTGTFLLPIQVTAAAALQAWQFSLTFDSTVVQEVDPFDGSAGIYGAQFVTGDTDTTAFILGGFPLNALGLVDGVAGSYPSLFGGVTGNGILAYILFSTLPGQGGRDPVFTIVDSTIPTVTVPEPATVALFAVAALAASASRRRRRSVTH